MGCRKNLKTLTVAERNAFTNALLTMKANGVYDGYVAIHQGAGGHGHQGPAFFSWHREFVLRFEHDLQAIDPAVNLPYWDWTDDNLNGAGTESLIWRNDLMGGHGQPGTGNVTDGPFAGWGLRRSTFNIFSSPGTGGSIATAMASSNYSVFRPGVEGPHGGAHVWVGGFVGNAAIAPRDPVFWLIHSNVDRLWAEWVNTHSSVAGFQPYLPISGGFTGHNLNDTMWPWNGTTAPFGQSPWVVTPESIRAADLIDQTALGYNYDTLDPTCRPVLKTRFKELKDRMPKELARKEFKESLAKEGNPKELSKELSKELNKELTKDRLPKELQRKEFKERIPKEFIEVDPKRFAPKEFREGKGLLELPGRDPFIRADLRPDLDDAVLGFDPDDLGGHNH